MNSCDDDPVEPVVAGASGRDVERLGNGISAVPVHPVEVGGDLFGELLQPAAVILDVGHVPGLQDQRFHIIAEDDLVGGRGEVADHEVEWQPFVMGQVAGERTWPGTRRSRSPRRTGRDGASAKSQAMLPPVS